MHSSGHLKRLLLNIEAWKFDRTSRGEAKQKPLGSQNIQVHPRRLYHRFLYLC